MEAVLAIERMQEPQSNLEEKDSPSIVKEDFSSGTDPFISHQQYQKYETGKMNQVEFFKHWNQQVT